MLVCPHRYLVDCDVNHQTAYECLKSQRDATKIAIHALQCRVLTFGQLDWALKPAITHVDHRQRRLAVVVKAVADVNEQPFLSADEFRKRVFGDRSEEHTSELQSLMRISYAVLCLQKN